jgi:hypothetical protein
MTSFIVVPEVVEANPRYQQVVFRLSVDPEVKPHALPNWNLDGVVWTEADPPALFHKHWPQTVGLDGPLYEIWRCPCGAFGGPSGRWTMLDRRRFRGLLDLRAAVTDKRLTIDPYDDTME